MAGEGHRSAELREEEGLKYLGFLQTAASKAAACVSSLYGYAKENAGPLKIGVEGVEGTVKTVVGPVYERIHGVPLRLLHFVDHKVEEAIYKVDKRVPPAVKEASSQAYSVARKAPGVARSLAADVHSAGVVGTAKTVYSRCEPMGKDLYTKYEPVAGKYALATWFALNRLPLFPEVAQAILIPSAAYCSEMYNVAVRVTVSKGYPASAYLPVIPVDKIAQLFSDVDDHDSMKKNLAEGNYQSDVTVVAMRFQR